MIRKTIIPVLVALIWLLSACGGARVTHLVADTTPSDQVTVLCAPPGTEVRLNQIDREEGDARLGYGASWDAAFKVFISPGAHTR